MIIKSKRIRARGSALKRALAHICDGEDKVQNHFDQYGMSDLPPEWDLVPRYDLWGIPYLPPPPKF